LSLISFLVSAKSSLQSTSLELVIIWLLAPMMVMACVSSLSSPIGQYELWKEPCRTSCKFLKDFYTYRGVERWVSLILTFYVKVHKNKRMKSCGSIWGMEMLLVLYLFELDMMSSEMMLGLAGH